MLIAIACIELMIGPSHHRSAIGQHDVQMLPELDRAQRLPVRSRDPKVKRCVSVVPDLHEVERRIEWMQDPAQKHRRSAGIDFAVCVTVGLEAVAR